ncbi:hypothetical protein ACLB2K_012924 [Fragaria x ananassa]
MDRERSSSLRLQIHALHQSFGEHRSPLIDTSTSLRSATTFLSPSTSPAWSFFFIAVQVFNRFLLFKSGRPRLEDSPWAWLNRSGKSCRLRWVNHLRPNIKRGDMSEQEEDLIIRLHKLLGNRWSLIAGRLPGRTDNEIKNYWYTRLSKKIQQK